MKIPDGDDEESLLSLLEEVLCCLLWIVTSALSVGRRKSNVNLLYALTSKHRPICDILSSSPICQLFIWDITASGASTLKSDIPLDINRSDDNTAEECRKTCTSHTSRKPAIDVLTVEQLQTSNTSDRRFTKRSLLNSYFSKLRHNSSVLSLTELVNIVKYALNVLDTYCDDNHLQIDVLETNDAINLLKGHLGSHMSCSSSLVTPDVTQLTFKEDESPEFFFIPSIWEYAVRQYNDIAWKTKAITLFDIHPAGSAVISDEESRSNFSDEYNYLSDFV